jgi:hypothetical protein
MYYDTIIIILKTAAFVKNNKNQTYVTGRVLEHWFIVLFLAYQV